MAAAERADWVPPKTLTVLIVPGAQVRPVQGLLDPRTLVSLGDAPRPARGTRRAAGARRGRPGAVAPVRSLAGRSAVAGPARPWLATGTSYTRALRALALREGEAPYDTEEHLADLVLAADARGGGRPAHAACSRRWPS